jgi:HK97 family phage major capsid protein
MYHTNENLRDLERKDIDSGVLDQIGREVKNLGDNVNELREGAMKDIAELRGKAEEASKAAGPELKRQLDALSESALSKIDAANRESQKRIDDLEAKLNRAHLGGGGGGGDETKRRSQAMDHHRMLLARKGALSAHNEIRDEDVDFGGIKEWNESFRKYLRHDEKALNQKALLVGSDPDGGYFVPISQSSRIIERIFETSPVRQVATVENIGTTEFEIPRDENEFGGGWVGETTPPSETATAQLGMTKITAHEIYAEPRATQKMLEDASIDVEAWLYRKLAERFSRIEAAAFVGGDGNNKPRGFLAYPNGTASGQIERISSGAAAALTADGLIRLTFALKEGYALNGAFMMRRAALRDCMILKDTTGQYLFRADPTKGVPPTLLGYDVLQAADMPNVGAGSLSVAFADWRNFYTIVDRLGMTVLRDPLTAKPYVKFYARRRVGGDVVNFEAGKLLVTSN